MEQVQVIFNWTCGRELVLAIKGVTEIEVDGKTYIN